MIRARNAWVLAFDNLSALPGWLSDAFCRLATGGGFSTGELHTNDEEVIFDATRPLAFNGIDDFITRADLLERSLLMRHPPIREEARRPESEFWAVFDAAHPAQLGAVLDRVSAGLRELPRVRLDRLPRMADFARFAVACESGSGEEKRFLSAYAENQAGAHEQALDASPVPAAVLALMAGRTTWEGTPRELFDALAGHVSGPPPEGWPKKPNVLTNKLRRLAPNLRRVHRPNIEDGRQPGGNRSRFVRITRLAEAGRDGPSRPPPPDPGTGASPGTPAGCPVTGGTVPGTVREEPPAPGTVPAGSAPDRSETRPRSGGGDGRDDGDGVPRVRPARRYTSDDRPLELRG